jgi:hypothetical protein
VHPNNLEGNITGRCIDLYERLGAGCSHAGRGRDDANARYARSIRHSWSLAGELRR